MNNTEVQAKIGTLCEWCDETEVQINMDKSSYLHSSANNNTSHHCEKKPIPSTTSFKDLGVVRLPDAYITTILCLER